MLKKGDIILLTVTAVAILASFVVVGIYKNNDKGLHKVAVIKQNNQVIRKIDLDQVKDAEKIEIAGAYHETILVEKGRIRFHEADCPDRVCVETGWLSKRGDTAACIPNHTLIRIEGTSENVDGVAY